jgi:hypothetical protein
MSRRLRIVVGVAALCLLAIEQYAPEPYLCPHLVYEWTVRGPGGLYGIIEMGYVGRGELNIAHSELLLGPFGRHALMKLGMRTIVILVAALAVWLWSRGKKSQPRSTPSGQTELQPPARFTL